MMKMNRSEMKIVSECVIKNCKIEQDMAHLYYLSSILEFKNQIEYFCRGQFDILFSLK